MRFPTAVVEWFSIEGVGDLFRENTNADELVDNNLIGETDKLVSLGEPVETKNGYLCVAVENQGVVAWYVRLDEGDNPPVYAADPDDLYAPNDDLEEEGIDLTNVEFRRVTDTFVEFIEEMLFGR